MTSPSFFRAFAKAAAQHISRGNVYIAYWRARSRRVNRIVRRAQRRAARRILRGAR